MSEVAISGWKEAGLLKPSVIKPVLTTIEKGLVLRKLGRLGEADRRTLLGPYIRFWENEGTVGLRALSLTYRVHNKILALREKPTTGRGTACRAPTT